MPRACTGEPLLQEHAALESGEIRDGERPRLEGVVSCSPWSLPFPEGKPLVLPHSSGGRTFSIYCGNKNNLLHEEHMVWNNLGSSRFLPRDRIPGNKKHSLQFKLFLT